MPIHEYRCTQGHVTEKLFTSFGAAEGVQEVECTECCDPAYKVEFSVPSQAHLLGNPDGYYKPSPTKRHSYKHINEHGNGGRRGE